MVFLIYVFKISLEVIEDLRRASRCHLSTPLLQGGCQGLVFLEQSESVRRGIVAGMPWWVLEVTVLQTMENPQIVRLKQFRSGTGTTTSPPLAPAKIGTM